MVDVTFPFWPPSVNRAWRNIGTRTILSAAGRDFRHEIQKYGSLLRSEKKLPLESILGDIEVSLILYPPDSRRRDLDNYFKAPLDALTHAKVWGDDSQIKRLSSEWGERVKGGGIRVIINNFKGAS